MSPPTDIRLKSQRFRQAREADWRRLEEIMNRVEKGAVRKLSDADLLATPVLYRSTLSALSVARETSLDQDLIRYLETLAARAYFFIYGSRTTLRAKLAAFFRDDWHASVRDLWRETLACALLLVLGAGVAIFLIGQDMSWFYAFMPPDMTQGRDPAASTEALRETLGVEQDAQGLSAFATFLFTHNAQVALLAFALGFAFCIPSAILVLYTGAMLGAFIALFASRGLGFEIGGWLAIHGVTELFAVVLAAAGGVHIGWAAAFPGAQHRLDAVAAAGRKAAKVMAGVVVMLFFAGLLEGFGRQLVGNTVARYAIGAASGLMWAAYFYGPRGDRRRG